MDVNCKRPSATFHYDGTTLLFVSTPTQGVFGVNVETFGYMLTDNTLEVEDRDYAGLSVMQHDPAGYSNWDSTNTIQRYKFPPTVGEYVSGSNRHAASRKCRPLHLRTASKRSSARFKGLAFQTGTAGRLQTLLPGP